MKIFRNFFLLTSFLLTDIITNAQDTIKLTPGLLAPSSLNKSNVQSLIQANSRNLQMLGISTSDAQNIANQVLPQIQGVNPISNTSAPQSPVINPNQNIPAEKPTSQNIIADEPIIKQGNNLPEPILFGQSFFRNKNILTYNHSTDMQAPDNYILGAGDQLTINIWGSSSYSGSYTVDISGAILPTQTGRIYVKGLSFGDAKKLIRGRFATIIDMGNSSMDVSLVYSRVISVNIVGDVFEPGTYTMPATNTAFNALISASGPTDIGSLRKIYIKRDGQTIKTLDVYSFLLDPESKQDFYLQDNDYIFVPPSNKIVHIEGEVLRPHGFELLENENLFELLKYAGGVTPKAFLNNIIIQRYEANENKLISINFDSLLHSKSNFILKNGDHITINSIPELLINQIRIIGPITAPGTYSFKNGQRISDIIKINPLRNDALLNKAYIIRTNDDFTKQYIAFSPVEIIQNNNTPDNILLKHLDVINFFNKATFIDDLTVNVSGAVRSPGEYLFGNGMSLKDALYFAGGLNPEAANERIEIARIMQVQQGGQVGAIPVIIKSISINKDLTLDEVSAGFQLQQSDKIIVRVSPDYDVQDVINVKGEVQYPGAYVLLNKTETLTSVLSRAGGLNNCANSEDAFIYRNNTVKGIILNHLDRALKKPNSKYNLILNQGDEIFIPKKTNIVSISGLLRFPYIDTLRQINVPYTKGKRAKFYIKKYGLGFEKRAIKNRTYVVNPGQNVDGCHKFILFNIYPKVKNGATVVSTAIPPKELKSRILNREPINWNQAIATFTAGITGIATLYVLFTKL